MGKLTRLVRAVEKKALNLVKSVILRRRSEPISKAAQKVYNPSSLWNRRGQYVLVDGTSVASNGECLSALGNDNVFAMVPQFRLKKIYSSDNQMLQRMQKQGSVIITPGKDLNGRVLTCNPNPFILDIAKMTGALIVSNYDFRAELSLDRDFPNIVRTRTFGFDLDRDNFRFYQRDEARRNAEIAEKRSKDSK